MRTLLDDMLVMGSELNTSLRDSVTKAELSGSLTQSTQVEVKITDPGWRFLSSGIITLAQTVQLGSLRLEVSNVETGSDSGVEFFTFKARPVVIRSLKTRRGAYVMRNVSPTNYLALACSAVGAGFVGEASAVRANISRDVPQKGSEEIENPQSDWTTFSRLAKELGYIMFEANATVYFGRPSWIVEHMGGAITATYQRGLNRTDALYQAPTCRRTEDSPSVTADIVIRITSADQIHAGRKFAFTGVPTFDGDYIATGFTVDLLDVRNIASVSLATPLNIKPNPPSTKSNTVVTRLGTRLATDFMYWVQRQIGDKFVTNAPIDLNSSDPNSFDGAELAAWGALQVGSSVPYRPDDLINYCHNQGTEISLASGINTRGAILWRTGFVGISLGGNRVIESVGGRVGIVTGGASNRYTRAAKIPGLLY